MRKPLLLIPALLLAGCRGEQVAFQFQPAAPTAVALAPAPASLAPALTPTDTLAVLASPSQPVVAPRASRASMRRRTTALAPLAPVLVRAAAPSRAVRRLAQRLHRRPTTEGQAESGLGQIGLFAIAVVLGILAGLGALVNVIFGVGFFTGVGYAAAGLVVLFLLYSLLSGGKKKK